MTVVGSIPAVAGGGGAFFLFFGGGSMHALSIVLGIVLGLAALVAMYTSVGYLTWRFHVHFGEVSPADAEFLVMCWSAWPFLLPLGVVLYTADKANALARRITEHHAHALQGSPELKVAQEEVERLLAS